MKKILFILLTIILTIGILFAGIGCKEEAAETTAAETTAEETTAEETTAATEEEEPKRAVMVSVPVGQAAIWDLAYDSFVAECEKLGIDGEIRAPKTMTFEEQIDIVDGAVAEGDIDAVVDCPWYEEAFDPQYEKGGEKGMVFYEVPVTSNSKKPTLIGWCGTDGYAQGVLAAEKTSEVLDSVNALVISTMEDDPLQTRVVDGFFEAAEDMGLDYKQSTIIFTASDIAKGTDLAQEAFIGYPEINYVYCTDQNASVSAVNAMENLGIPYEDITILAIDMNQATYDFIKAGKVWATINQNGDRWGSMPAQQIYKYWTEGEVDSWYVDTGVTFYDKNNLDEFPVEPYGITP